MIDFGKDFFKWFSFAVQALKLFIRIFGNEEEKEQEKNNNVGG